MPDSRQGKHTLRAVGIEKDPVITDSQSVSLGTPQAML